MGEKSDSAAEIGHVTTKEENGLSNVTDGLKPNDSAMSVVISGAKEEDNCGNCREQDKEDEQLPPEFIPEDPNKEEGEEEQQAGDLSDAASFLEDDLHCTPLDEIMGYPVEITPNPPQKKKLKRKKAHSKECPRNPSRELFGSADSKVSKKPSQKRKLKEREKFQDRDITEDGVWVQCENMQCKKWRFLKSETDPAKIPEQWTCIMHPDENFNSCDKLEEDYSQLEFIHNKFTEGSIVWAKMQGFPWWPAMVETDPDRGEFMFHNGIDSDVTHYHCVFLDEVVSRSWVRAASVKKFEDSGKPPGSLFYKKKDYSKSILPAKKQALAALKVSIKERIDTFGFSKTFKGVWTKQSRDCSLQELDDSEVSEDILCSILSSEDMKELEHETDGWISEAVEAMRETTTEDMTQLLVADDHKEKKHGCKRKTGNVDDRGTRKKHKKQKKNHKSKKGMRHDADRKKKGKNKKLDETAMTNSGEEDGEVLHGEENEIEEVCEAIEDEATTTEIASTVAEDTNMVAVTHLNEGGQEEEDVTVECDKETSNIDPIVLDENESNEMKIHVSSNRNDDTGVQEQGEGTSKTEKIQRQRERKDKKQKALEEKARKQKEREMKKEKKEQEMKEKEEKRKTRELKKQQVKERKEKKKTEKDEKAKKQIAEPISKSQPHDQKVIGQKPSLQKKAKFSAPKGKPKAAFLAPVQAATCNKDMEVKTQKDNNRSASPNDIEMHNEDHKEYDQGIKQGDMTTASKDSYKDTTKYAVDANEESVDASGLHKTKRKKFSVKRKLLGETKVEKKLKRPVTVETDQGPATEEEEVRDGCTEVSGRGDSKISERRVVDEEKYDADDVDVLDLEWTDTVLPSLGVKADISPTGDDDSDPFEAVEE